MFRKKLFRYVSWQWVEFTHLRLRRTDHPSNVVSRAQLELVKGCWRRSMRCLDGQLPVDCRTASTFALKKSCSCWAVSEGFEVCRFFRPRQQTYCIPQLPLMLVQFWYCIVTSRHASDFFLFLLLGLVRYNTLVTLRWLRSVVGRTFMIS